MKNGAFAMAFAGSLIASPWIVPSASAETSIREADASGVPAPESELAITGDCQVAPADVDKPPLSATDVLKDCGGVLTPPATGDAGMIEPAPHQGETPVLDPDQVPEQPSE